MAVAPRRSGPYLLVGLLWLILAVVAGASGWLSRLGARLPLIALGLTLLLVIAGATLPGLRLWLAGLNLRQIVAFHLTRFVGIYFLVLYGRAELPYGFAVPGGWGDIAVATAALAFVLLVPDLAAARVWLLAWNVIGLADILFVVATAGRLTLADPGSMGPLFHLPLSLLPTFLVPLIIASHLYLFRRLWPERIRTSPPA